MKKVLYTLFALLGITACSEKESVFYSTTYTVTDLAINTPETQSAEADYVALVDQIKGEALAAAPVGVTGSYRLDFSRYDGGELYVQTHAEAEPIVGEFDKVPASNELSFRYGEEVYTAKVSPYTTEEGMRCVVFEIDLTDYYKALYPALEGTPFRLVRKEFTSHIYD